MRIAPEGYRLIVGAAAVTLVAALLGWAIVAVVALL